MMINWLGKIVFRWLLEQMLIMLIIDALASDGEDDDDDAVEGA